MYNVQNIGTLRFTGCDIRMCFLNLTSNRHSVWLVSELGLKEYICYITSGNPLSIYAVHVLHNAHRYGPMETTLILLTLSTYMCITPLV